MTLITKLTTIKPDLMHNLETIAMLSFIIIIVQCLFKLTLLIMHSWQSMINAANLKIAELELWYIKNHEQTKHNPKHTDKNY